MVDIAIRDAAEVVGRPWGKDCRYGTTTLSSSRGVPGRVCPLPSSSPQTASGDRARLSPTTVAVVLDDVFFLLFFLEDEEDFQLTPKVGSLAVAASVVVVGDVRVGGDRERLPEGDKDIAVAGSLNTSSTLIHTLMLDKGKICAPCLKEAPEPN